MQRAGSSVPSSNTRRASQRDGGVDVLLAHSHFLAYDPKQLEKMRPYPPLATLYAAAYLRSLGYSVAVFDAMISAGEHEFVASKTATE